MPSTDRTLPRDPVLRTRLIQAVAAARMAVTLIDHHAGDGDAWPLVAKIRAHLVDAFHGLRLVERVPCPQGLHEWWCIDGATAACPSCAVEGWQTASGVRDVHPAGGVGL